MLIVGCQSQSKQPATELFTPEKDQAQLQAFYDTQAGAAAHEDASLYSADFTGDELNSLGKAKLDSLLGGCEHTATTQIYLFGANDTPEHRDAIAKYLKCRHIKTEQFAVVSGPNPNSYTSAAQSIKDLDALSSASSSSSDGSAAAGAGAAGLGGATTPK